MAKTRAIVKRRKAVRNIRKITRTMELIATARFKKAMDRAVEAEAYTRKIGELVADLSRSGGPAKHPLLEEREKVGRSLLLVMTSNRGLCGGYNANLLKEANKSLLANQAEHPVRLEVSGKRGIAYFKYRGQPIDQTFLRFEDKPAYDDVDELAQTYLTMFLDKEIDKLEVAYTRFVSIGRQIPTVTTLLPMSAVEGTKPAGGPAVGYEFLPDAGSILAEIVPASFKVRLFKTFLDAAVSEQIARMVAMKGATENASKLIKALSRKYNRARQSQITSELAEIIGAADAIK